MSQETAQTHTPMHQFSPQTNGIGQSPSLNHEHDVGFENVTRMERVFTTLIRDQQQGLGFSISGGKGAEPFIEGSDAVFISKVADDGPAAKDAKLLLGDKIIQINGIDVSEADHADVVSMLTGFERFVRLCVERQITTNQPTQQIISSAPTSASFASDKSPKLFGLPKPYTGLKLHGNSSYISPSSYMANRPDYTRRREPGQYSRTSIGTNNSNSPTTPNTPVKTSGGSLGSYGKLPGLGGILMSDVFKSNVSKSSTLPGSRTLPELVTSNEAPRTSVSNVSPQIVDVENK
jgi:protein scribble